MHEIAWPIIAASSVISAIILRAEEIKVNHCKLLSWQFSTNQAGSRYVQMRPLKRKTLVILFLWSVTLDPIHHAGAWAQFWHRFPRGTTSYLCKTITYWGTFRGPTVVFRKLGFLQPQVVYFYSILPSFWAKCCSSPCIIAGCVLLMQTVKQMLCSTRELLF